MCFPQTCKYLLHYHLSYPRNFRYLVTLQRFVSRLSLLTPAHFGKHMSLPCIFCQGEIEDSWSSTSNWTICSKCSRTTTTNWIWNTYSLTFPRFWPYLINDLPGRSGNEYFAADDHVGLVRYYVQRWLDFLISHFFYFYFPCSFVWGVRRLGAVRDLH